MSQAFVEHIFAAFAAHGGEQYGERVSQLDHALQCAHLAAAEGAPEGLIVAALLHDFGHLIEDRGAMAERDRLDGEHEALGAATLSAWFDGDVTGPIALHVAAKRYLCATEPRYFGDLSEASKLSLDLQGGAFTADEAERFAVVRFAADAVRLRRWDDAGKVVDRSDMAPLESYRPMLVRCARSEAVG